MIDDWLIGWVGCCCWWLIEWMIEKKDFTNSLIVIFMVAIFMHGESAIGVRLFLGQISFYSSFCGNALWGLVIPSPHPTYLHYLNTSAVTMLIYTFNNATAVILILSVISIMAPQVSTNIIDIIKITMIGLFVVYYVWNTDTSFYGNFDACRMYVSQCPSLSYWVWTLLCL